MESEAKYIHPTNIENVFCQHQVMYYLQYKGFNYSLER